VLADRDWHGARRHLLIHANGNGYVYVLDRTTGEILSTAAFAPVNATSGIDTATGTPRRDEAKTVRSDTTTYDVCPAAPGATIGASAFAKDIGVLFIPANFLCMDIRPHEISFMRGTPFTGVAERLKAMPGQPRGALIAWDIAAAKAVWTVPEAFPLDTSVLATAGGIVFYGTLDGWFRAVDAKSGKIVWQYKTGSQIGAQPISYGGPDGRQYVAIIAGPSGPAGSVAGDDIDTRDLTAAHGFANALPDLPRPSETGGKLYVFRLP
jgi:alcohol dehydrogenase (cytochrome c)